MVQMKYFGDCRDYFKHDLLTFILKDMKISNYVFVPMLTTHREDNEGKKTPKAVSGKSEALRVFIEKCNSKSLGHWKSWMEGLEGHLINYKTVEPVDETFLVDATRDEYWRSFTEHLQEKDALIFLDPDTGLESGNSSYLKKMGREKYILNDEIESLRNSLDTSSILMIYQHLPNNKHNHEKSVMKKMLQLKASNENCFVCGYREDDLAFLFLSKSKKNYTHLCSTLTKYDAESENKYKSLYLSTKEKNECMDVLSLFETWRVHGIHQNQWGLAWFLAYQFCRRFYASHGVVPHVIEHEGLGYYGIQLNYVPCKVNQIGQSLKTIGRITCTGDVENWQTGGPGDHGLETSVLCQKGVPTSNLVFLAIKYMGLPTYPFKTHINCRHKRWGSSFELMFEIATILALRNPDNILRIWNNPYHTEQYLKTLDPKNTMQEHPGAFVFETQSNTIVITGDGRCLDGSGNNLWEDYMDGSSPYFLAICIENQLKKQEIEGAELQFSKNGKD